MSRVSEERAATRLWEKGEGVDAVVHRFTVGTDPDIDRRMARWDAIGSAAQAWMLEKIGILTAQECRAIVAELREIECDAREGRFVIPPELEDCHTVIESRLVERLGEFAGKIHTGRSRNDQTALNARLYIREQGLSALESLVKIARAFTSRFEELRDIPMPGYTHLQPAMPASIGMWIHAYAEWVGELLRDGLSFLDRINSSPLGTGSGFGVPLPLDREYVARLLGFSRIQRSAIDTQNSRGRFELKFLRFAADIGGLIEKLSEDLELFSMREFGFFSLPNEMTTGSSMMPQKHNPDVLELLRGNTARIRSSALELVLVMMKLPSGYHRDFQLIKEPVVRAAETLVDMLPVAALVVSAFRVHRERLEAAMVDDLYVTYDAFRQVRAGIPFREAYRMTAERLRSRAIDIDALKDDFGIVANTVSVSMGELAEELVQSEREVQEWRKRLDDVVERVLSIS